jgi:hypothetical protein
MAVSSSILDAAITSKLALLSPATTTLPSLAPLRAPSRESRRRPAFGRSWPWQRTQDSLSIGWTFSAKVTPCLSAGGGSLLRSNLLKSGFSAAKAQTAAMTASELTAVALVKMYFMRAKMPKRTLREDEEGLN